MKMSSFYEKACYYVGSSVKLASRISSHRSLINIWDNYKKIGSPIFYRSVREHDWFKFKFGILEYVDLSGIANNK